MLVEESKTLSPTGADRVQFLMEANQGQTKGTVDAVASSGEKSRLLLLLETRLPPPHARSSTDPGRRRVDGNVDSVADDDEERDAIDLANVDDGVSGDAGGSALAARAPPCAVLYDEIDAHVGGKTAVAVGRLLANQGRDSQVGNDSYGWPIAVK